MIFKKKKIKTYKDKRIFNIVTVNQNFENLVFFTNLIKDLEHFVFFGTLLGLIREQNLIEGDDDIDFYINIREREKLIFILKSNNIIVDETLSINKNESFLQIMRTHNNINYVVDFYFYDSVQDELNIVEKWNFEGKIDSSSTHLKIPKIFIYPIKPTKVKNHQFYFPSQPLYLCEFLYGPNWKIKMKKDEEYQIKVINNKPVFFKIKKNFFGIKKIIID